MKPVVSSFKCKMYKNVIALATNTINRCINISTTVFIIILIKHNGNVLRKLAEFQQSVNVKVLYFH